MNYECEKYRKIRKIGDTKSKNENYDGINIIGDKKEI